jgi:hypothetical protein
MRSVLLRSALVFCLVGYPLVERLVPSAPAMRMQGGKPEAPDAKQDSGANSISNGIPPSFFAMNVSEAEDYPSLPFGTLGHPAALAWARGEPSKRNFRWNIFDGFVEAARSHGLVDSNGVVNVVLTLGLTPGWAVSEQRNCTANFGLSQCAAPPDNIEDWREFVTALVEHYNGKTAPHIKYYELWNEVTGNYWKGSPEDLVKLAAVAYPIIHSDPYSLLLAPSAMGVATSTDSHATAWIASYLRAGGSKYADGGTFHGYLGTRLVVPFPMPEQDQTPGCGATRWALCAGSILTQIRSYRKVFDENGLAGKPMFNTEGSWGPDTISDPDLQAAWLARYYLLQASVAGEDNLQFISWFSWGRPRGDRKPWGQVETDRGAPNQAGFAYEQVRDWILGARIVPCAAKDSVWTCSLTRAGGYEALAVWDADLSCGGGSCSTTAYSPDRRFTVMRNLNGEKVKITGGSVRIGAKPLLLENK